jgi:hypothetical protein
MLREAGIDLAVDRSARSRVPAIMIGDAAQQLMGDVFGCRTLFDGMSQIRQRIVAWGSSAAVVAVPHEAVVTSEQALLERLPSMNEPRRDAAEPECSWSIFSSRPLPGGTEERAFGDRIAAACAVKFRRGSEKYACWIESVPNGWLFLLPGSEESGWLLSVGGPADSLLAQSRCVADQIENLSGDAGRFPSHPRILDPLCAPGWLACGTAAVGFDPLCGDGTGNAVREAILTCAVLRAVRDGGDRNALLDHYRKRVLAGFERHLNLCLNFYRSGHDGPWWQEQQAATERGLEWCRSELSRATKFQFKLNGFVLERIA